MNFFNHLTLRNFFAKINIFCILFFFLFLMISCSPDNSLENLYANWLKIEELIEDDKDYRIELANFYIKFYDLRLTPIYKNLIISEKYGYSLQNLEDAIESGDVNKIRIALFKLEQTDKMLTQKSNLEYSYLAEGMLIFSVIISILLFIIFKNFEKKKNEAKQLGLYSDYMVKGMESERTRISKEIHDTVLQDLKALSLKTELIENDSPELNANIKSELLLQTNSCIKKLRSICKNLTPVEFKNLNTDAGGFVLALQNLREEFSERTKKNCILKTQEGLDISCLSRWQIINIFRIIQEALNNIEKHAEASNISIIITRNDDAIQKLLKIYITDNGRGFNSARLLKENSNHGHFGLYNMKERAKDIGAAIEIISEEGEGTEIKLEVPLK